MDLSKFTRDPNQFLYQTIKILHLCMELGILITNSLGINWLLRAASSGRFQPLGLLNLDSRTCLVLRLVLRLVLGPSLTHCDHS